MRVRVVPSCRLMTRAFDLVIMAFGSRKTWVRVTVRLRVRAPVRVVRVRVRVRVRFRELPVDRRDVRIVLRHLLVLVLLVGVAALVPARAERGTDRALRLT